MVKMVVEMENYILSCSQEAVPAQQWIAPQRHCSSLTSPSTASLILAMQALLLHTQPGFWQETELKPYCFNSNNGVCSSLFPFLNNPLPNLSQCSQVQRCVSHRHRKEADTEAARRGSQHQPSPAVVNVVLKRPPGHALSSAQAGSRASIRSRDFPSWKRL